MLYRAYFSVPGFGIVLWFWQCALAGQMDDKSLWVNASTDRDGSYYAFGFAEPEQVPGACLGLALGWLCWNGVGG